MPSPFPGMDPYLEGSLWTTLHFTLSAEIVRYLAPRLRPRYLVLPIERFVVDSPPGVSITATEIYPDAGIMVANLERGRPQHRQSVITNAPLEIATVISAPIPQVTVEIRDTANRQLVTDIEVLSPTNKRGDGYREYLAKRRSLLISNVHLLEIDLLRRGSRVPMQQELPKFPYFVFLSRATKRPVTEIWPIALNQPLPTVPVPLLPGDADVPLDLQHIFTQTYDLLGYDLAIDYTQPPEVSLPTRAVRWLDEHLRSVGLRP